MNAPKTRTTQPPPQIDKPSIHPFTSPILSNFITPHIKHCFLIQPLNISPKLKPNLIFSFFCHVHPHWLMTFSWNSNRFHLYFKPALRGCSCCWNWIHLISFAWIKFVVFVWVGKKVFTFTKNAAAGVKMPAGICSGVHEYFRRSSSE